MDDGIPPLSSDYEITYKIKKNCHATFKIQMKKHCLYIQGEDDALLNIRLPRPTFVLKKLDTMLNLVVERISL